MIWFKFIIMLFWLFRKYWFLFVCIVLYYGIIMVYILFFSGWNLVEKMKNIYKFKWKSKDVYWKSSRRLLKRKKYKKRYIVICCKMSGIELLNIMNLEGREIIIG